jgi:hypothetical protein
MKIIAIEEAFSLPQMATKGAALRVRTPEASSGNCNVSYFAASAPASGCQILPT